MPRGVHMEQQKKRAKHIQHSNPDASSLFDAPLPLMISIQKLVRIGPVPNSHPNLKNIAMAGFWDQ